MTGVIRMQFLVGLVLLLESRLLEWVRSTAIVRYAKPKALKDNQGFSSGVYKTQKTSLGSKPRPRPPPRLHCKNDWCVGGRQ